MLGELTSRPQAYNTQPNKGTEISKINHRRRRTYSGRAKPPAGFDIRLTFTFTLFVRLPGLTVIASVVYSRRGVRKITSLFIYRSPVLSALQTDLGDREEASPHHTLLSGYPVKHPTAVSSCHSLRHTLLSPSIITTTSFINFAAPPAEKSKKTATKKATFSGVVPSLKLTFGSLDGFQWAWGCRHECRRRRW